MNVFTGFTAEPAQLLRQGGVGVLPTDTVYGIVCSLLNQDAVQRIYDLKDRPLEKPIGTILIADPEQIEKYVDPEDLLRAQVYWPGSTSVILPLGSAFSYAHRGVSSLPFRIPSSESLRAFLRLTGPLATSSANRAGHHTAATAQEAMGIFREGVDFYIDGGNLDGRKPSTIIKLSGNEVEVIRGDRV